MPTPNDVLSVAGTKLGLGRTPPGSNINEITHWYGADGEPWCAMFVSWVLAHSGFSNDRGTNLFVPGVTQTTSKGWAYVPYLLTAFRNAGRVQKEPQSGDIVAYGWDADTVPDHTGLLDTLNPDGTFFAIEGNNGDAVVRVHRSRSVVLGFCRPPYDGGAAAATIPAVPPDVPAFPGFCSLGSIDTATRLVQERLAARGWIIKVDGDFGSITLKIVRAFQKEKGLDVDGVVGPKTWIALWTAPIT